MLKPSGETLKIRRIVEQFSDEELLARTPKDLQRPIEKAGLSYEGVRDRVNNELARARRIRGLQKKRRRTEWPGDKDFQEMLSLFAEFEQFRNRRFGSWADLNAVATELLGFRDQFGSDANLLSAISIKLQNEQREKQT